MAHVVFAKAFGRHVECPSEHVEAMNVRACLEGYFQRYPKVRSYVVDETFTVRRHVALFVNENQVVDRGGLSDAVGESDTIHVFQALSGG